MNKQQISGSGGGKGGGGGGGISEDADTLSGVTRARYIDLISEGRIDGLVNGDMSVYLDGVPLRDIKGTPNYKPFRWNSTLGTPDQLPIPGFSNTSSEVGVGVQLTVSAGQISRSIPDSDADSVRLNLSVNGLSKTSNEGKVSATKVEYAVYGRRGTGSWIKLKNGVIEGKTSARYPRSDEVLLSSIPGTGACSIGVTRTTPDATSALVVDGLSWDSLTVINYEQYSYPHSALFALEIDARYFSQVPTRTYHVRGLWVRVPTGYNPVSRAYPTVWDGTFVWAYTNNPAWCYYDLATNPRYGLGKRISDAQINKWELYSIAKYCDEMVPTGNTLNISDIISSPGISSDGSTIVGVPMRQGPTEPRFTLNCVINTQDDAYKVLNQLSSAFRGMTYWASSGIGFTQDRPAPLSMVWNNANVLEGKFHYQGSSRAQRHTVVSVGWNDPGEDFRQRYEYVEDRDGITRYGIRPVDIVAFGCTSRSQARRVGLWLLYTERMETDAITFRASLDSSQVSPGDVGQIMDSKRLGARWGGRLVSSTTTTVTLDASLTLAAGAYTLSIIAKDGSITTRTVSLPSGGPFTVLTVTVAMPEAPTTAAVWALSSTAVSPVYVRVVGVKSVDANTFDITVLRHNPGKFDAVDLGARLPIPNNTLLTRGSLPAVTGLVAVERTYRLATSATPTVTLEISWDRASELSTRDYTVIVSNPAGVVHFFQQQTESSLTIRNLEPEVYTIRVAPVSYLGVIGSLVSEVITLVTGRDTMPPEGVQGLTATSINGTVQILWAPCPDLDYSRTVLRFGASFAAGTDIVSTPAGAYLWPYPGAGTYTIWAAHIDTTGNFSSSVSASVTVSAPTLAGLDSLAGPALLALAQAQANLAETQANSYADGIVTVAEAAAIAAAQLKADAAQAEAVRLAGIDATSKANLAVSAAATAAQAKADLAETTAKSYADGIVTTAEASAIAAAQVKATAAQTEAVRLAAIAAESNPLLTNSSILIGGRNFFKQACVLADLGTGVANIQRSATGFAFNGNNQYTGIARLYYVIPKNGVFTIGFDLVTNSPTALQVTLDFADGTAWTIFPTQTVQHFSHTFTVSNYTASTYNFIDFSYLSEYQYVFTNFKVELGNIATDWTPAPEDVDAQFTAISSDSILSKGEKPAAVAAFQAIYNDRQGLVDQANLYGLVNDRDSYSISVDILANYLNNEIDRWSNNSVDSVINPTNWANNWNYVYQRKQILITGLARAAGTRSTWAGTSGAGKPSDFATSDVTLIASGGVTLVGNTATAFSAGDWHEQVYSKDSFTGGAYASGVVKSTNDLVMIALNTEGDLVPYQDYQSLDYAIHTGMFPNLMSFISGSGVSIGTWAVGDVLAVTYDGVNVRWVQNGNVLKTVAVASNIKFYFDSSFISGATISNIRFGPMSNNDWSATGGTGKPSDNATVGANWNGNITNKPADTALLNSYVSITPQGILLGAGGGQVQSLPIVDNDRYTSQPPSHYAPGGPGFRISEFKHCNTFLLPGNWFTLETIGQYSQGSGAGYVVQYAYVNSTTYRRYSSDTNNTWGAWVLDLDRTSYTGDLNASYGAPVGTPMAGTLSINVDGSGTRASYTNSGIRIYNGNNVEVISLGIF